MRCFIAIDIPKEVKDEIAKIQKLLPEFEGKLTEKENLHLTLKFLGEVSPEEIEKVKERLGKIKLKRFSASLGGLGIFSESFVRIVWIKLGNCDELQGKVDYFLKDLFKKEERFMGHLTIARVKQIGDKKKFLDLLGKVKYPKTEFEVDKISLKNSVLTKKGPIYEDIFSVSLD